MKQTKAEKTILTIVFIIFSIYAFTLIFPFVWSLINSFKTNQEFFNIDNAWKLPQNFSFDNYINVFRETGIVSMFLRSLYLVVVGTALSVFMSSSAAYVVSKYEFKGRNLVYTIAITVMIIPTVGSLSATFRLVHNLGIYNNLFVYPIFYGGAFGFGFLLFYGFFKGIPWTYAEAAFVDGASHFQVFFKVMLPQIRPAIISFAIIQGINIWNDFFGPFMLIPDQKTVAVGLQDLVNVMQYQAMWPMLFAAMIISAVPVIVIFLVFNKTIMENTIAGGLKG